MPVDPSVFYGPTLYPSGGWLKVASVNGNLTTLDNWEIQNQNEIAFEHWAIPVVSGPKEKTLHCRGTSEVGFDLRGDLTQEGAGLIGFLGSNARGAQFPITVQQNNVIDFLSPCYFSSFRLMGGQNSPVTYQLMGKCLNYPASSAGLSYIEHQHLVPSWATGNQLVDSWSITHEVALTPAWWNNQGVLPTYYRFGESEWTVIITTVQEISQYDTIALGVGSFTITGMVKSRGMTSSGRDVRVYPLELTNVNISANPLTVGAFVFSSSPTFQGSPDGI